jgi:mono/diheme cytochrome c family protein
MLDARRWMLGSTYTFKVLLVVGVVALTGCIQEMANQPRYEAFEAAVEGQEQTSSRSPVAGTIARGQLELDEAYFTGKENGQAVSELPPRALEGRTLGQLLDRGRERFTIFCSHCHGQVGGGTGGDKQLESMVGMVVQRGFPSPPTYHQERLRRAPIGHFFDVATNGFGRMPAHRALIGDQDRWAIAAYVRALQLSQYAAREKLTPADIERLETINSQTPLP